MSRVDEGPFLDQGAEGAPQAPRLHVVRHHHHHLVTRLHKVPHGDEVGFGSSAGHLYVIARGARIPSGDGGAERQRAVRLRIAERLRQQRVAIETVVDELAHLQRSHAALRQVDVHLVLVDRLHPLQRELFDLHESRLYILVVSETSLGA